MVNLTIRKNDHCVIGLPACGYVFSSTKSCFIGYGFKASSFEKDILLGILAERGIEPIEAAGNLQPGKYAFCHKICSKIITSQFCIAILNNDIETDSAGRRIERPNANVNMEYGLMLGHNKYVVPFQHEDQALPFNVSGLDTVKYNSQNFSTLAKSAVDQAISDTAQSAASAVPTNELLETYLVSRGFLFSPLDSQGDKDIFRLGQPLGFNLLTTFDGMSYLFLGNFMHLDATAITWRLRKLYEVFNARLSSVAMKEQWGLIITAEQKAALAHIRSTLRIMIFVTGRAQSDAVSAWLSTQAGHIPTEIVTVDQIQQAMAGV